MVSTSFELIAAEKRDELTSPRVGGAARMVAKTVSR